jgi:predicted enzyme related to lactoylglutathione lyase
VTVYVDDQQKAVEFYTQMPWGTFATFLDLDGNEFGLTSQEVA